MKRFIIIILSLMLFSTVSFAELSDEVQELVEDLRFKHYNVRYSIGNTLYMRAETTIGWGLKAIEIVDFEIEGEQLKVGWEVWINDKCYYIILVEKED